MSFSKENTENWWRGLCSNERRMNEFLVKLYHTEFNGYADHMKIISHWQLREDASARDGLIVLENIAADELKHANAILSRLSQRGYNKYIVALQTPDASSKYWTEIMTAVSDFETYCAANHFGESLAVERFKIMLEEPTIPKDVYELISSVILADEVFHAKALKRLVSQPVYDRFKALHNGLVSQIFT